LCKGTRYHANAFTRFFTRRNISGTHAGTTSSRARPRARPKSDAGEMLVELDQQPTKISVVTFDSNFRHGDTVTETPRF
jgi:hypothetical protein